LNAETFQIFVEAFAPAVPDRRNMLLLDHSGAHTAQRVRWPEKVPCVWLPPYGPALNPIARVWRDLKDELAWRQCPDREAHQADVGDVLPAYDALTLQALTGDAYVVEAMNALCS
jgi:transposase